MKQIKWMMPKFVVVLFLLVTSMFYALPVKAETYPIEFEEYHAENASYSPLEHATYNGPASVSNDQDLEFDLDIESGYRIKRLIFAVDSYEQNHVGLTINYETGEFKIPKERITGKLYFQIQFERVVYPVVVTENGNPLTHATYDGPTTIDIADSAEPIFLATIKPIAGRQIIRVEVYNAGGVAVPKSKYHYDYDTGVLSFRKNVITGPAEIRVSTKELSSPTVLEVGEDGNNKPPVNFTAVVPTLVYGQGLEVTITPNEGYFVPSGHVKLYSHLLGEIDSSDFTYDPATGKLIIPAKVISESNYNFYILVRPEKSVVHLVNVFEFAVDMNGQSTGPLTHVTYDGPTIVKNDYDLVANIKPIAGYVVSKAGIVVAIAGEAIEADAFTYNVATGQLIVPKDRIHGDVTIGVWPHQVNQYSVTVLDRFMDPLQHVTYDGPFMINAGQDLEGKLTAHAGHIIQTVTVFVGFNQLTNCDGCVFDLESGYFKIPKQVINHNVILAVEDVKVTVHTANVIVKENGSTTLTHLTYEGPSTFDHLEDEDGNPMGGVSDFVGKLVATKGYYIDEIEVYVHGIKLSESNWEYNADTKMLMIPSSEISGEILIEVITKVEDPVNIDVFEVIEGSNVTPRNFTHDAPNKTTPGETVVFTLTAKEGFAILASDVKINCGYTTLSKPQEYTFNEMTGQLMIPSATVQACQQGWFDVFVVAQKTSTQYTVTFDLAGHGSNFTQTVNVGATATVPTPPTATGYVFKGWYADNSYSTLFDFTTPIGEDATVYAKWEVLTPPATQYTVTFDLAGHGTNFTQTVKEGAMATMPAAPSVAGYQFKGWYTDNSYATAFDFNTPIMANTVVYAKFEAMVIPPTTIQITFDLAGGTLSGNIGTMILHKVVGDSIVIPPAPVRAGYKFLYWEGSHYNPGDIYVVTGPHTFTAVYERVKPKPGDDQTQKPGDDQTQQPSDESKLPNTGMSSYLWLSTLLLGAGAYLVSRKQNEA